MDLDNMQKTIDSMANFFNKPIFMYPFLAVFAFGSRVCWDYLQRKRVPSRRKVLSLLILSMFSVVILILVLRRYHINEETIRVGVPLAAFLGHSTWTFIMENKNKLFKAIFGMIPGIKFEEDEDES